MSQETAMPEIIPYHSGYQSIFKQLNLEWLDAYHLTEDHDLVVLDDPQGIIIDRGGVIFLAKQDDKIIGSAALMKVNEHEYELAKMAVTPAFRGKGISKLLLKKCLDHARTTGAEKISLFSNHRLTSAIALYEKHGFKHVEVKDSPFETADVRMELIL